MEYIIPIIVILLIGGSIYTTYNFTQRLSILEDNINILKKRIIDTTSYFYKQNQDLKRTIYNIEDNLDELGEDIQEMDADIDNLFTNNEYVLDTIEELQKKKNTK
jgi:prefoldin subunit 5